MVLFHCNAINNKHQHDFWVLSTFLKNFFLVSHQIFHQQIMFTEKDFVQSFYTLKCGLLIKTPNPLETEHRINLTLVINDRGT